MASFVMSASAVKAPAAKVSGLGFRKAVSAVAMPVQSKPVQARAAFSVVCGKPGAKAKTNKSAAKRFKITPSSGVSSLTPARRSAKRRFGDLILYLGHVKLEERGRASRLRGFRRGGWWCLE